MFGIGSGELLLILVIALIVLGPERMPRVARDLGRVVGDLRRTSDQLRDEFLNADSLLAKAAEAPPAQPTVTAPAGAPSPLVEDVANAADAETPFDREMREARERLQAQRNS